MAAQPHPRFDLKKLHTIFWEIGLIVTLLLFIMAMRTPIPTKTNAIDLSNEPEIEVPITPPPSTTHRNTPPPPIDPVIQPPKPSDEPIEERLNIDELENESNDEQIEIGPPPLQPETDDKEQVFQAVEQEPQLIGGLKALQQKVKYPARCRRANIEGRVTLQFVVNTKGEVENINVLRGIGGGCDEAAIEAVKKHATFKPGRQRGNAVNVRYSLPIRFKLQ